MGATGTIIGADVVECQGEILGTGGEHPPHVAGIPATQFTERRITEYHVIGITGVHGLGIQPLKRLIEPGNQCAVGVTHAQAP
ncbi:hypothetical protein D3C76_417210 [compost metagenome]